MIKWVIIIVLLLGVGGFYFYNQSRQFKLPKGETKVLETAPANSDFNMPISDRKILITDGVKHSVPLNEILSGGPPKDGIPSIDDPKFLSTKEADSDFILIKY
ncbi:MAG: hypothetical protein HYT61_03590 [Candidatus Yanofskybacteria bacterium]|nr:hypothetical protein [Candidatus Yanofskybacteria bacterium]